MIITELYLKTILESLSTKHKIFLPINELNNILAYSEIIFEQNTIISDFIRILRIGKHIVVQEKTDKNEIALHLYADEQQAMTLVNERLNIYEKMWDGCGCKVRYYD
jgi:hypothetical protein